MIEGDRHNQAVPRDAAILELLYSSRLQLTELVRLNVEDVDFAAGTVRVQVAAALRNSDRTWRRAEDVDGMHATSTETGPVMQRELDPQSE